ncbi:carbohydrate-binding protein [Arachidicoccus ginsenosidimutans]|nr:carbohydrate-binding protein [Arachidicoccus sp. BS20]
MCTNFLADRYANAQSYKDAASLYSLQQKFVDLKFGMFIHFNIPTYANQDWPDPDLSPAVFNPTKLDCDQWAKAAKSAHMTYGCLTTKHHSGFCIWDTKTTDYNVMHSPLKKDVVREFVNAFRKNGLKVMLYFSILDTHHRLRPNHITPADVKYIEAQLTELLTNYGPIEALIIDGWDAPWSRISYDQIPFEEIYEHIKSLQPNCLVMDLNSAKYPAGALFYSDIKSYEQNAGQHISKETNKLPALSCYPLQQNWFWKTSFPTTPVKDPQKLVNDDIIPFNNAYCNFILNVAPNRDGLIDDNALAALKKIGELWKDDGNYPTLPKQVLPIISHNLAKNKFAESSWSDDMNIMDFGNDDDFGTSWISNYEVKHPWYEVDLGKMQPFNMLVVTEGGKPVINKYRIEYFANNQWKPLLTGDDTKRVKIHRFETVKGSKVRILIDDFSNTPSIAEFGVYDEKR